MREVHDLHIWAMSHHRDGADRASGPARRRAADDGFLAALCGELQARFGIGHATLQVESGDPAHPCVLAPAETL